jgi:hypothetical protein
MQTGDANSDTIPETTLLDDLARQIVGLNQPMLQDRLACFDPDRAFSSTGECDSFRIALVQIKPFCCLP